MTASTPAAAIAVTYSAAAGSSSLKISVLNVRNPLTLCPCR